MMEAAYRRMTPRARVEHSVALTALTHAIALAALRQRHPEDDERTLRLRLAARAIDAATMKAAFAWPPAAGD